MFIAINARLNPRNSHGFNSNNMLSTSISIFLSQKNLQITLSPIFPFSKGNVGCNVYRISDLTVRPRSPVSLGPGSLDARRPQLPLCNSSSHSKAGRPCVITKVRGLCSGRPILNRTIIPDFFPLRPSSNRFYCFPSTSRDYPKRIKNTWNSGPDDWVRWSTRSL
ncbi:hypothetical protein J6590_102834 [Homalodisca vitripennis]|nr:hypothetical protein J6590_102834 [Homalodisca vitripennis]